jgi:hypothetical protein
LSLLSLSFITILSPPAISQTLEGENCGRQKREARFTKALRAVTSTRVMMVGLRASSDGRLSFFFAFFFFFIAAVVCGEE